MIIERHLAAVAFDAEWGRQMRFIAGPRQAGKTTLAKRQLTDTKCEREDLASLTRIQDRERVRELFDLLPGTVGSPVSESSLGAHIQVGACAPVERSKR